MAKKKAKSSAKPAHVRKAAPQTNYVGWIVAIVVIIALIWYFTSPGQQPTAGANQPTTNPEAAATGGKLVSAEAPAMDSKCTNAIGIVPGSKTVVNNVVTITFKNNGRTAIPGTYFSFSDGTKTIYRKNADTVNAGATQSYTVDLNQVATDLGSSVRTFVIFPIQDGKACLNQRAVVINYA